MVHKTNRLQIKIGLVKKSSNIELFHTKNDKKYLIKNCSFHQSIK